jgi:TRAP-type uncharacterized transport system fused permease subunit
MSGKKGAAVEISDDIQDLVLDNDAGARRPSGFTLNVILGVAFLWSMFQLWIASPLPFALNIFVLDGTKSRYIHLAFALVLVFLSYPRTKKSPREYVPISDWIIAGSAALSALYLLLFYEGLSKRSGMPNNIDIAVSVVGIAFLIEATRRALGPPLATIATLFLLYTYFGRYMPDVLMHKGANLTKIASHQWLATEGVFGIALGVSTSFVFLFVLFGALLERAGAGNYFIKVAFSLLGHLKGGPAKAAVLSSALTGLISGSSIANVVTTGTFTIPLMRRVGFSREKAGSVEVASSVNGQIMPPVMGAAAFLMVEYIGIPYIEVVKHAFIPAVISYIALLYIVHLEAVKYNMPALPKRNISTAKARLLTSGIIVSSLIILTFIVYHIFSFVKSIFPDHAILASGSIIAIFYLGLLWYKSRFVELEDDNGGEITELPEVGPTVKTGLHFILPIVVLVWCLMVERLSPGLSAFWATVFMIFILVTQKPAIALLRGEKAKVNPAVKEGFRDLFEGLVTGARNMAAIGIATAAAGIIVGVVTQTGVGNKMTEVVSIVAGDSVLLMLIFTAFICLILGMGLPTTANYIVVSSLMATVIVQLGKQNGLLVPLIAVHLFVFYFGIMADVTPPVGLASFAAAAVSGGDPIKTSLQAFVYSIRTMILPFIFMYDNEMLLIGVNSVWYGIFVFLKMSVAILIFTAATQNYLVVKSKIFESALLLIASLMIFLPNLWINQVSAPYKRENPLNIERVMAEREVGEDFRVVVVGRDFLGRDKRYVISIVTPEGDSGRERLENYGAMLYEEDSRMLVDYAKFGSQAKKDGFDMDFEITEIKLPRQQPSKHLMYIPAMLLFFFVYIRQKSRANSSINLVK